MSAIDLPIVPGWEQPSIAPPASPRRIGGPAGGERTHVIGDPAAALPSREEFEAARTAAYEAGLVEGRRLGFDDAVQRTNELQHTLLGSLEQAQQGLLSERRELLDGVIDLAIDMAAVLAGHTPHDNGAGLGARIRAAVHDSVGAYTRALVSATDVGLVDEALTGLGIEVDVAADLGPGEARLVGEWSTASLTVESIRHRLRDVAASILDSEAMAEGKDQ